jgi:hypothetical protein
MNFEPPINDKVNIQDTIIQGYCKNKCKLRYNYPEVNSACVSKISVDSQLENKVSSPTETSPVTSTSTTNTNANENNYLSLTFNETKPTPSVSFNGLGYNETEMRVYAPSLHLFNNKRADVEVCIYHQQISGLPEKLLICIPFMKQTATSLATSSESSNLMVNMFNSIGGCSSTPKLTTSAFSLNTLLPSKPYFYYKNDKQEHVVCFHTTKDNILPSDFDISIKRPVVENDGSPYTGYDLFFSGEQVSEKVQDDIYLEVKKIIDDAEKESEEFTLDFTDTEGFTTMNNMFTYQHLTNTALILGIAYTGYKIFETKK